MTHRSWLWLLWGLIPVFAISFHYGPGQVWLARDLAGEKIEQAEQLAEQAQANQEAAYKVQLEMIDARRNAFVEGIDWQTQPNHPLAVAVFQAGEKQDKAYGEAGEAWGNVTNLYSEAIRVLVKGLEESNLEDRQLRPRDQYLLEALRWSEARAMVRSGMVFNGIDQFQSLLDLRIGEDDRTHLTSVSGAPSGIENDRLPMEAIREELAAAQYIGARLLREEGRSPEIWKPVANAARQQYRLLAEQEMARNNSSLGGSSMVSSSAESLAEESSVSDGNSNAIRGENAASEIDVNQSLTRTQRIQRNLEQVLNLEQSSSEQLEGIPLPRQAPMARRPGDGEPGQRPGKGPGRGPLQDGPPGEGAGIPGPFGSGW